MDRTFLRKKNNAKSTLKLDCSDVATSIVIQDGDDSKFPTDAPFVLTLFTTNPADGEIVKVTSISEVTSTQFYIDRAQEGTVAQSWDANVTNVQLLVTAGQLEQIETRNEIIVSRDSDGDYNCDGNSDETEINEAIAEAVTAGGGIVHLKKGTYIVDGIINILGSNITLEGEGPGTIIQQKDATDLNRIISVSDGATVITDVVIKDLKVDGNKGNQSTGYSSPLVIWGTSEYICKRISVLNCTLTGAFTDSLKLLHSEECIIEGNHFHDNDGTAIFCNYNYNTFVNNTSRNNDYFFYGSGDNGSVVSGNTSEGDGKGLYLAASWRMAITGNSFYNPENTGIWMRGCERCAVTGNSVYGGDYGIKIGSSENTTQRNTVSGNVIAYQGWRSIWLYDGEGGCINNTINANAIYGPWQQGIRLYGAQYNTITGNTIDGASRSTDNTYNSILLESHNVHSVYNIIANNNCIAQATNKAKYHIYEDDVNQDYNLVIGNICTGGVTGQINLQGSNSVRGTNIPDTG